MALSGGDIPLFPSADARNRRRIFPQFCCLAAAAGRIRRAGTSGNRTVCDGVDRAWSGASPQGRLTAWYAACASRGDATFPSFVVAPAGLACPRRLLSAQLFGTLTANIARRCNTGEQDQWKTRHSITLSSVRDQPDRSSPTACPPTRKHRVLVLEAGPGEPSLGPRFRSASPSWSRTPPPIGCIHRRARGRARTGAVLPVPRGKLLGGSSFHQRHWCFVRGQARDYDTWAQLGNRGWSHRRRLCPSSRSIEELSGRWRRRCLSRPGAARFEGHRPGFRDRPALRRTSSRARPVKSASHIHRGL